MLTSVPNPVDELPSVQSGPHSVTIGLMGGREKEATLRRFSRYLPDLELSPGSDEDLAEDRVSADLVAFVAFHRGIRTPSQVRSGVTCKQLRVQTVGGELFSVAVDPSELQNPIGFYGWPTEATSRYQEVFFYAHGVRHRESAETLGSMIRRAGVRALSRLHPGDREGTRGAAPSGGDPSPPAAPKHKLVGERLVEAGLATVQDIEAALATQRMGSTRRLGEILVQMGVVTEVDLALALSDDPAAMREVPMELMWRPIPATQHPPPPQVAEPVARSADPPAEPARPEPDEARADEIEQILRDLQNDEQGSKVDPEAEETDVNASDNSVIRLANQIIIDAYRRGASDIHIEPNGRESATVVRFRVDGECIRYQQVPPAFRAPLVARLKIMARLDISERRKPQDGKIQLRVKGERVELRVATLPTVNDNEDVVLRILAASKPLPLEKMGLSPRNLGELSQLVKKPYGLVLCVGPTGSGKTTTLHSALGSINTADTKIWTAEDPVEITQPGLRQVQVNPKIGFTFASAMRAFLRADPDVIMVGEMRDKETASTAVEASLTGHLVLSTLHTNSAPETITRLLDMGLDPFAFSDALLGVLAQRLARALCRGCRVSYEASAAERSEIATLYGAQALAEQLGLAPGDPFQLWRAPGCAACNNSGYKGRMAIHELLVTNPDMQHAIAQRVPVEQVRGLAVRGGMHTLMQDGLEKAIAGLTDLPQVLAVCAK